MSKHAMIREHLLSGESITGIQAMKAPFFVYRLSSCINRIREEGIPVITDMVMDYDRNVEHADYFVPKTYLHMREKVCV